MKPQAISDPLGDATTVTIELPREDLDHFKPWDALTALHRARLESVSAVFIDEPSSDRGRWPSANAALLEAIIDSDPESTLTPLVWARVRTAPRYPSLREMETEKFPFLARSEVPREPQWPADFSGVPTGTLNNSLHDDPGARLVQHIPPGDGWHRIAWVREDVGDVSMSSLLCECSLQHVINSRGGTMGFLGGSDCAYRPVTAYLRALSFQQNFPEATLHALREMVDVARVGTWLSQHHGDQLWGSNLYLQTVSAMLDVPLPWELSHTAVEAGLISLNGAVVDLPHPLRAAPAGPIMDWDSRQETDGDLVVWWSRLDDRYQIEVTRDPDSSSRAALTIYDHGHNNAVVHTEQVGLAYGAIFGPDAGDANAWKALAAQVADEHDS